MKKITPEITPLKSLVMGSIITFTLVAILTPIGTAVLKAIVPQPSYLYSIPLVIFFILLIGFGGLRKIKVAHQGVPLILGERIKGFLFLEGWHWIPPIIAALEEVDTRKLVKEISKADAFTKDKTKIKVDATIEYQVVDPYSYLSLGEKVVEIGLENLTKQVLRLVTFKKDLDEALGMQQELNDVLRNVLTPGKETNEKIKRQYGISDEIDKATKGWGIDVINVFVAETQPSEEIAKQLERVRAEEAQQKAEEIEAKHTINLIRQYQNEGLSLEETILVVQTERDKAKRNIDEKRIVIPERTGQLLKEIIEGFRRGVR